MTVKRILATALSILALAAPVVVATGAPVTAAEPIATKFEIRSYWNGKCVEILGLNGGNGAQLGVWDCWNGANQRWTYPGAYDQVTRIRSLYNNRYMDLLYHDNRNGAWVGLWDATNGTNQWWQPRAYNCGPGECPIG